MTTPDVGETRGTARAARRPSASSVGDLTKREPELVRLLEGAAAQHPQGYTLRTQLLRSLKKAVYRHTPDGHFGLHKKDYTHFTSPIRRYCGSRRAPRLRCLPRARHARQSRRRAIRPTRDTIFPRVARLGEHLSLTEVNSTEAERDSVKVKLLEFFERELDEKTEDPKFAADHHRRARQRVLHRTHRVASPSASSSAECAAATISTRSTTSGDGARRPEAQAAFRDQRPARGRRSTRSTATSGSSTSGRS